MTISSAKHEPFIITIDGPSGAGKGTAAFRLAEYFGFGLLDSGALYRIVGLMAHQAGLLVGEIDEDKVAKLTAELKLGFVANPNSKTVDILIDEKPLMEDIRNETVGKLASMVAVFPKVRQALLELQQNMGNNGLVADGRDMGTVVFPNAKVKIFLTASAESRAQRRVIQLKNAGKTADYDGILAEIRQRDERDENRSVAPSKPAIDALVMDSSLMTADEVFDKILQHCQNCGVKI